MPGFLRRETVPLYLNKISDRESKDSTLKGCVFSLRGSRLVKEIRRSWDLYRLTIVNLLFTPSWEKASLQGLVQHLGNLGPGYLEWTLSRVASVKYVGGRTLSREERELGVKKFWNWCSFLIALTGTLSPGEVEEIVCDIEEDMLASPLAQQIGLLEKMKALLDDVLKQKNFTKHWKFHCMICGALFSIMKKDLRPPLRVMRYLISQLSSEFFYVRQTALSCVNLILPLYKGPTFKKLVTRPNDGLCSQERHIRWFSQFPSTEEEWQSVDFVEKNDIGFYDAPEEYFVYSYSEENVARVLTEEQDEIQARVDMENLLLSFFSKTVPTSTDPSSNTPETELAKLIRVLQLSVSSPELTFSSSCATFWKYCAAAGGWALWELLKVSTTHTQLPWIFA